MDRFAPFTFRNGKITHNRVVVPPMASQTADASGFATTATFDHYRRLSQAGAGLVFVEYSFVDPRGRGEANQLGASSMHHLEGLRQIRRILHEGQALAGLQIVHVGGKSTPELTGASLMAPSAIPVPVKGWQPEVPVEMSTADIEDWVTQFLAAAQLAWQAGFDILELHAAHGYGLNQWLSPLTNQRQDKWGGENRARLLLHIVRAIKFTLPELLLAVRLPAQDHAPGGVTVSEMIEVAQQLERAGLDLLDVSSGIGGWRRQDNRQTQGYLIADAELLKRHVGIPVIGVGGIETGEFIDHILQERLVDFAAVGRALLKDPRAWGDQNLSFEKIKCI